MPSPTAISAIESGSCIVFWCAEIGLDTPLRVANAGRDTHVDGDLYTSCGLTVEVTRQLFGGTVHVEIDDDGSFEESEDADDCRGASFAVSIVYRLPGGDEVESWWTGEVGDVSFPEGRVRFSAGAAESLRSGLAAPETDDRCVHDFKGPGCTYAGATATCDGSLAACQAMAGGSNEINRVSAEWAPEAGTVLVMEGTPYSIPSSPTDPGGNTAHVGRLVGTRISLPTGAEPRPGNPGSGGNPNT
jgi:hypothetical protein